MGAEQSAVASAVVRAPQERVWELLSDTSRYADYVVATREVTRTDGPARLGSTYHERNKFLGPINARSRWEVVEFSPPHRQVHRGEGIPMTSSLAIQMETVPAGDSTEVTFTLSYTPSFGPLGGAVDSLVFRRMVEADNRKTVEAFAELANRELA